jgi:hypothetical protein
MSTKSNLRGRYSHNDFDLGVIIIFLIVSAVFLFSLSQSTYGKKIFSHKTDINNLKKIVSLK